MSELMLLQQKRQAEFLANPQVRALHYHYEGSGVGLPDGPQPDATVAVIDGFRSRNGMAHGDRVSSVLKDAGGLAARDVQHMTPVNLKPWTPEVLFEEGKGTPSQRLDHLIDHSVSHVVGRTAKTLETIESAPGAKIKTINHSEGYSPSWVIGVISEHSFKDGEVTESGRKVFEGLGIKPGADNDSRIAFHQALMERTTERYQKAPAIQEQRQRMNEVVKRLAGKGVAYVNSAGNDGNLVTNLEELGMTVPKGFLGSPLQTPDTIVVGSIDDRGTPELDDDRLADFSSQAPEVDLLAPGTGFKFNGEEVQGTSYSAPYVAGKWERLRRDNPSLSHSQLRNLMANQAGSVQGSELPVVR